MNLWKKINQLLKLLSVSTHPDGSQTIEMETSLRVEGEFRANEKFFTINHPDPEKKDQYLAHSCIESNQHTVLYAHRITHFDQNKWVADSATGKYIFRLQLPSYFKHLVRANSVTAILTPVNSMPAWFYVCEQNPDEIAQNILRIESNQPNSFNILIMGVRSDQEDFIVEFDEKSKANVRRRVGQPDMPDNRKKSSSTKKGKKKKSGTQEGTTKSNVKEDSGEPLSAPPPPPKTEDSPPSVDGKDNNFSMFTQDRD